MLSDIPIFREIGGDAALFFDPDRPESLVGALRSLEHEGEWERRSAASVAVAARFNWAASADRLLELMRRTAAPGSRRHGARRRRSRP